jgi:hypothetical protein
MDLPPERSEDTGAQFAIHRVPPEIWVIIFCFVLGREPFGMSERRAYGSLRGVCTLWRRAAFLKGICTGLDIELDDWADLSFSAVKEKISHWLAIINPLRPYHLALKSYGSAAVQDFPKPIIEFLLKTTPPPTRLSIACVLTWDTILGLTDPLDGVTHLELELPEEFDEDLDPRLGHLKDVLPNLDAFVLVSFYDFTIRFKHSKLRHLSLLDIMTGFPADLAQLLSSLPSLRELELNTTMDDDGLSIDLSSPINLPSIEVLTFRNEDLAVGTLRNITLPSLKFYTLTALGQAQDQDKAIRTHAEFFARSDFTNGVISIQGNPNRSSFAAFVGILPADILLHVGIRDLDRVSTGPALRLVKEVFCTTLDWLEGWSNHDPLACPVKIYVPGRLNDQDKLFYGTKSKWLRSLGYILEVCSTEAMEQRLRSQVPWMLAGSKYLLA